MKEEFKNPSYKIALEKEEIPVKPYYDRFIDRIINKKEAKKRNNNFTYDNF